MTGCTRGRADDRCAACGWMRGVPAAEGGEECRLSVDGMCAGTIRTLSARTRAEIRRRAWAHGAGGWWWQIAPRGDRTLFLLVPAPRRGWGWSMARVPILPEHLHGLCSGWRWDGDEAAPTIEPSIHAVGEWHGYLRAGRLVSV